ncbi:MAG: M23 family metallopeptidase, partial [Pseudomonadota bacterium]
DFAAPTGTPIYAAGHGVVERASRFGGYGHYIRIRHANGYKTAYAHLSRYARGMRKGRRVRQGDVIGYVGSTGASTGPHLHYEVYTNGRAVDVMRLKLPTGRKLAMDPEIYAAFEIERDRIDAIRNTGAAPSNLLVAAAVVPPTP